jgi:hypothetical protein
VPPVARAAAALTNAPSPFAFAFFNSFIFDTPRQMYHVAIDRYGRHGSASFVSAFLSGTFRKPKTFCAPC